MDQTIGTDVGNQDRGDLRRGCAAVPADRSLRAAFVPRSLHGVRARVLRRLHGRVEREAGAPYAAHERDVQLAPDLTKISADLSRPNEWIRWLSVVAIVLATINMFGGFAVTQRMLQMFRK